MHGLMTQREAPQRHEFHDIIQTDLGRLCQMSQWSQKGAHYLLQARTAVLNGDLSDNFERWHPGLKINEVQQQILKEAA